MNLSQLYRLCTTIILAIPLGFLSACGNSKLFESMPARSTGIDFSNDVKETQSLNILNYLYMYNGGGVAVGDVNNDGNLDFVASDSGALHLYLNNGTEKAFADIELAQIRDDSFTEINSYLHDITNDGYLDLVIQDSKGINRLYRNNRSSSAFLSVPSSISPRRLEIRNSLPRSTGMRSRKRITRASMKIIIGHSRSWAMT